MVEGVKNFIFFFCMVMECSDYVFFCGFGVQEFVCDFEVFIFEFDYFFLDFCYQ